MKEKRVQAVIDLLREIIGKKGRIRIKLGEQYWVITGSDDYYEVEREDD